MSRPFLLGVALFAATTAFAQQAPVAPPDPSMEPPHYSESVSVGFVLIPFTAIGPKGTPLTDVRERDVQLYVDGVRVRNDMFERSMNAPVSFTILLDGSGSMGLAGKMDAARSAVATLVTHRKPGDDFALYVFAESAAVEVVPFTQDPSKIVRALDAVKPFGKTAFFDALATMPQRSDLGANPTRAIILLSDGIDNASHLTRAQLPSQLEGVAVPIYPLGLREAAEQQRVDPKNLSEELSDLALLDEIANLTGGRLFVGNRPEQLSAAVDALENNLRAQYLIGFPPTGAGAVKYRRISLKLAGRVRSVRVRAGYLGTEPPLLTASTSGKGKKNERKRS
jgi:Ca-activated chloride channel family protein